jgi:hypothetical protein
VVENGKLELSLPPLRRRRHSPKLHLNRKHCSELGKLLRFVSFFGPIRGQFKVSKNFKNSNILFVFHHDEGGLHRDSPYFAEVCNCC